MGKTTTTVNLGYYLAKMKKRVLIVDFDPQGNATSGVGIEKNDLQRSMVEVMLEVAQMEEVIVSTKYKGLEIAPVMPELANAEMEMAKMDKAKRFALLRGAVRRVAQNYDVILIDLPPSLSLLTVNGMIAADYLLLPVQTEFYALEGVTQLLESMKLVRKAMNPQLKLIGVLATMYDMRTALSAQVLAEIQKYFKGLVFKTTIPRNVRLAEAPSHGVPVGAYDHFSKGARAYKNLAKELLERMGKE